MSLSGKEKLHTHPKRRLGNRGQSSVQWTPGPRESDRQLGVSSQNGKTSLFVDCIPQNLSVSWLEIIFRKAGDVQDVYISKKVRQNTSDRFGFVRFGNYVEAVNAIKLMNGFKVQGKGLKVSLAKYSKGGNFIKNTVDSGIVQPYRRILNPPYRDGRSYQCALMGRKQKPEPEDATPNTIPIAFSLNVQQNMEYAKMLQYAIIAEHKHH
ncbi:uncharacterized protein LOC130824908 [Amaranthus tricolor]|uniref:uncharacterized protein LOC130824908 n=1 Tax=Amaranthus tricolor TaxID=29722 RepID=UPI00258E71AA|nr:uncharacterized protein LOC130824908 [Amaranthus tricolor]